MNLRTDKTDAINDFCVGLELLDEWASNKLETTFNNRRNWST